MIAGILAQALPLAGRQFEDEPYRMGRDAVDDIAQIDERIDLEMLAGLHQRTEDDVTSRVPGSGRARSRAYQRAFGTRVGPQ